MMSSLRIGILACMVSIMGCQPSSTTIHEQLNADLLGHWTMDYIKNDQNCLLRDAGPLNLTGKCTGKTKFTEDRFGQPGKALYFDGGLYDYAQIPHDRRLERITSKITIAMWVYNERNSSTFHPNIIHNSNDGSFLVSKGRDIADGSWYISTKSLILQQPSTPDNEKHTKKGNGFKNSLEIPMNQWILFVGVVNDRHGKMYVNGDVWYFGANSYEGTYRSIGNTDPIILGQTHTKPMDWDNAFIYPFRGKMDEVRIWNRALSEQEVRALYEAERPSSWQEWLQAPVFKWGVGFVLFFLALWGVWYRGQIKGRSQALQEAAKATMHITGKGDPTDAIYVKIRQTKATIAEPNRYYQTAMTMANGQTEENTDPEVTYHENLPDFFNPPEHLSIQDQNWYLKIITTIKANKNTSPFGTQELANALNTTTRTLQRDTKQLFNCSPKKLIEMVLAKI